MNRREVIKRNSEGDIVAVYSTIVEAARAEGVCTATIQKWVGGYSVPKNGCTYEAEERAGRADDGQNPDSSLCWSCDNATGGCSWSREFKPVNGWNAERRNVNTHRGRKRIEGTESYFVKDCPEFVRDKRRRR